jgi:hypothetical protein
MAHTKPHAEEYFRVYISPLKCFRQAHLVPLFFGYNTPGLVQSNYDKREREKHAESSRLQVSPLNVARSACETSQNALKLPLIGFFSHKAVPLIEQVQCLLCKAIVGHVGGVVKDDVPSARLRAVPSIEKKAPGMGSRLSSWVTSFNPFKIGDAVVRSLTIPLNLLSIPFKRRGPW